MSNSTRTTRLSCESLEARDVPATWTVNTPDELIARMTQANNEAGDDTIVLVANTTYTLTATNNSTYGATGLPVVESENGSLTIVGNGATIERSATAGTPQNLAYFRLLAVEAGATLNADGLTLQGGYVQGTPALPARGGAIYNLGTVQLTDVSIRNNRAYGYEDLSRPSGGGSAQGGGIYSDGTLTISGGEIRGNVAQGGRGGNGRLDRGGAGGSGGSGGSGLGGGVYVAGGTASLSGVALEENAVRGGAGGNGSKESGGRGGYNGGRGGNGKGGGLHLAGGATTLTGCSVKFNEAVAGAGGQAGRRGSAGSNGVSEGGGIYVGVGVAADWAADTTISNNTAASGRNVYRA